MRPSDISTYDNQQLKENKMNVVVTGAAGYIGTCLCKMLLEEFEDIQIKAFDNLHYNQWNSIDQSIFSNKNIQLYKTDVLLWEDSLVESLREADYIFPLASIVGAPACDEIPEISCSVNYHWFETLISITLDGYQRIIYPNTNSGYGTTAPDTVCTEETESNPISLYGQLKQSTEDLLLENYDNSVCFRLATVFGLSGRPRLDLLVNNFVYRAVNEGKLDIFDGQFRRNFVSVRDVCRAFLFAMEEENFQKMKGEVYNLGTDSLNSTKLEFAKKIQEIVGCEVNEHQFKTDPDKRDYLVSNKKLNSLGFESEDVKLDDRVEELAEFCNGLDCTNGMFNY
jgi:nucleoside-diphosphate-sugar epimerase|tara:strand:- start:6523 stop:7539 length:1017 start_codon:yes stop_codon:yes gene_type:complete